MLSRIVLGLDGSDGATAAAEWVAGVAGRSGGRVKALCALSPLVGFEFALLPVEKIDARDVLRQLLAGKWAKPLLDAGVKPSCEIAENHPAAALLHAADLEDADLLVVGRSHHAERWPHSLGGTTNKVLRDSTCPVAVIPPRSAVPRSQTVVVGVDGSPNSKEAFKWALAYGRLGALRVRAVRVAEVGDDLREFVPESAIDSQVNAADQSLRALLRTALPADDVTGEVIPGHVGSTLVEVSAGADVLVLGSRGHTALGRILLGSTSHFAAAHAACPTVVVPPRNGGRPGK
jgi:nucleotide-binding universal stress UspA family protein